MVTQDMHNYGFSGLHKLSLCKKKGCGDGTRFELLLIQWITKESVMVTHDSQYY